MSWNFIADGFGCARLRHTVDMPPMKNIPKAGPPHILPAPLVEGQTIEYTFHDDKTADFCLEAVALSLNGTLQWLETKRTQRPRAMVRTAERLIPIEAQLAQRIRVINHLRERWLRERCIFLLGSEVSAANFQVLCGRRGVTLCRRVLPDREELLVNNKIDSTFWPLGRPENINLSFPRY